VELDALISLSIANDYYEGHTCQPIIKEICPSSNNAPYLSATSLGHPVIRSDALGKGSFVPNDVHIGGAAGHANFILLTGPNMGASPILYKYNPVKTIKTNVIGTLNMLGLAKRVGARILQTATSQCSHRIRTETSKQVNNNDNIRYPRTKLLSR